MELEIIRHSEISREELLRVVDMKNVAWPHPITSHFKWLEDNLLPDDLHVILKAGGIDYAYMNLCPVTAMIDGHKTEFMGIGNVCAKVKGKGYGGKLISLVNQYLHNNSFKGLLFCRDHVMHFYTHYGWSVVNAEKVSIEVGTLNDIYMMSFNVNPFGEILYNDRIF